MKSDTMRLIEAAERERDRALGMLEVQDATDKRIFSELYDRITALVQERDEAQALARGYRTQFEDLRKENAVTAEHLRVAQERIQIYVSERDEARQCARELRNRLWEFAGDSTDARKEVLWQEADHPWLKPSDR